MKWSLTSLIITFVGAYLALAVTLAANKASGRDYLVAIPIAIISTVIFEVAFYYLLKKKKKSEG